MVTRDPPNMESLTYSSYKYPKLTCLQMCSTFYIRPDTQGKLAELVAFVFRKYLIRILARTPTTLLGLFVVFLNHYGQMLG
jgi:hypothetical protein